jgi:hypothetical protein
MARNGYSTQKITPDRWVHLEQGEVRGRFTPEGFVLSFLTKLAQAELRAGCDYQSRHRTGHRWRLFYFITPPPRPSARAISVERVGQKNTDAEKGE